jgi:hypothetical protein
MGCDIVWVYYKQTFRRSVLPQSSVTRSADWLCHRVSYPTTVGFGALDDVQKHDCVWSRPTSCEMNQKLTKLMYGAAGVTCERSVSFSRATTSSNSALRWDQRRTPADRRELYPEPPLHVTISRAFLIWIRPLEGWRSASKCYAQELTHSQCCHSALPAAVQSIEPFLRIK